MTFDNGAWAINGALLGSSIARRAQYAATNGAQGVVSKGDLKVTQLGVPGVGVQISAGAGLVLNDYQDSPNETYVVSNPDPHIIPSGEMPASSPADRSFIVAVTIGDPDFSQTGHPWMGAGDPPVGEEQSFEYVRVSLIPVSAGATSLGNISYPALPLARIDIPMNTTTITNAMIHDLRTLAQPRQSQEALVSAGNAWNATPDAIPSGSAYAVWGHEAFAPTVKVPSWATRAIVIASVNGVILTDGSVNVSGGLKATLGAVSSPSTTWDFPARAAGAQRDNLQAAGQFDVTSIAGQTVPVRVEGFQNVPAAPTANQKLTLKAGSQVIFDIRFFEE